MYISGVFILAIHVSIKIFPVINMFSAKTLTIHFFRDINSRQVNVNRVIDKFRRLFYQVKEILGHYENSLVQR